MILLKLETKLRPSSNDTVMWRTLTSAIHPSYKGAHLVGVDFISINQITLPLDESAYCSRILTEISSKRYNLVKPLKPFFRTKVKTLLKGLFKWS